MGRNQFEIGTQELVISFASILLINAGIANFATIAQAQGEHIDLDERRAARVPHRHLHGKLGDTEFQIAVPIVCTRRSCRNCASRSHTELRATMALMAPSSKCPPRVSMLSWGPRSESELQSQGPEPDGPEYPQMAGTSSSRSRQTAARRSGAD